MLNIRHTGIVTSNIEKSISFYQRLGFAIQKDMMESGAYIDNFSGLKNVLVRTVKMSLENGDMIELLYYHSHLEKPNMRRQITQVGCSHVALTVPNLDELYNELKEEVEFNSEPQYSPDGYAKVTFCKDPDGSLVELVEVLR